MDQRTCNVIKGIAIILVVLQHVGFFFSNTGAIVYNGKNNLIHEMSHFALTINGWRLGDVGVILFLFLAGYAIARKYPIIESYKDYIKKRFLRLYPLYFVALLIAAVVLTPGFYATKDGVIQEHTKFNVTSKYAIPEYMGILDDKQQTAQVALNTVGFYWFDKCKPVIKSTNNIWICKDYTIFSLGWFVPFIFAWYLIYALAVRLKKSFYKVMLFSLSIIIGVIWLTSTNGDMTIGKWIHPLAFPAGVFLAQYNFREIRNKYLEVLGKYSYEIYLFHIFVLVIIGWLVL